MPRDPETVSRGEILDSCALFERDQISLAVLVINLRRAMAELTGPERTGVAVELAYLEVVPALPEERQRYQAQEHTRAIRKLLYKP